MIKKTASRRKENASWKETKVITKNTIGTNVNKMDKAGWSRGRCWKRFLYSLLGTSASCAQPQLFMNMWYCRDAFEMRSRCGRDAVEMHSRYGRASCIKTLSSFLCPNWNYFFSLFLSIICCSLKKWFSHLHNSIELSNRFLLESSANEMAHFALHRLRIGLL